MLKFSSVCYLGNLAVVVLQIIVYFTASIGWSACSASTQDNDKPDGTSSIDTDGTASASESEPPASDSDPRTDSTNDTAQTAEESDSGQEAPGDTVSATDTESTNGMPSTDEMYEWHVFLGSSNYDYMGGLATTSNGDVVVTGNSREPWTGPTKEPPLHSFPSNESAPCWNHYGDLFVARFDAMGQYKWHTFWGPDCVSSPPAANPASSVALAADDAIYVVGQTTGAWSQPELGAAVRPYSGGLDGYVLKLAPDGSPIWHGFFGGAGDDANAFVAVGPTGEIYVLGYGDDAWLGPGLAEPIFPHPGSSTSFLVKLDSNGSYAWHIFLPDLAWQLVVDASGRLYLGGQSERSWHGPGGETPLQPFAGSQDATIIALDEDGAFLWHTFVGAEGSDWYHGVAAGDGDGVVLIGRSDHSWSGPQKEQPTIAHSGGQNLFALSLDSDGNYRWHTFAGFAQPGPAGAVFGADRRDTGELLFAGSSGSSWLGPLGETPHNAFAGGSDIMLLGLTKRGGYDWHSFYGSPQSGGEDSPIDEATAASLGEQNVLYAAGTSSVPWDGPHAEPPKRAGNFDDIVVLKVVLP